MGSAATRAKSGRPHPAIRGGITAIVASQTGTSATGVTKIRDTGAAATETGAARVQHFETGSGTGKRSKNGRIGSRNADGSDIRAPAANRDLRAIQGQRNGSIREPGANRAIQGQGSGSIREPGGNRAIQVQGVSNRIQGLTRGSHIGRPIQAAEGIRERQMARRRGSRITIPARTGRATFHNG